MFELTERIICQNSNLFLVIDAEFYVIIPNEFFRQIKHFYVKETFVQYRGVCV